MHFAIEPGPAHEEKYLANEYIRNRISVTDKYSCLILSFCDFYLLCIEDRICVISKYDIYIVKCAVKI